MNLLTNSEFSVLSCIGTAEDLEINKDSGKHMIGWLSKKFFVGTANFSDVFRRVQHTLNVRKL